MSRRIFSSPVDLTLDSLADWIYTSFMVNNNVAAAKTCQFCGSSVPAAAAIIGCSPCQKENLLQWLKRHQADTEGHLKMASYTVRGLPIGLVARAKIKASKDGTSLDEVLQTYLARYLAGTDQSGAGKRGGKARAEKLSPERRQEIARMGGKAKARAQKMRLHHDNDTKETT